MQKRLEIAKRIKAASGGWPDSFVKSGVEAMRECPQEKWKELHEEFEAMAPGYELTTAVLLKITEEVVEQASEDPEAYKNVIELFLRFIKRHANERLGRDIANEMWVCQESARLFQQHESDPTVDEARQMVELVDEVLEELKGIDLSDMLPPPMVVLGCNLNIGISLVEKKVLRIQQLTLLRINMPIPYALFPISYSLFPIPPPPSPLPLAIAYSDYIANIPIFIYI